MIDRYQLDATAISVLVHVVIFGGMFLAFDFRVPVRLAVPLVIEATLVTEVEPSPVQPEPEPEPELEPDNSAEDRARLEEEKRLADLRTEQDRIREQQLQEDRRRREQEAERRRRQEEETERRRAEAERKRLEELERQRTENARLRREAEAAEIRRRQQQEIETEQRRIEALQADDMTRWAYAIHQAIANNFVLPASAPIDLECIVDVRQLPDGTVADVQIGRCNGDDAVKRAIEAAVNKASPLPPPDNPRIFERDLRFTFKPEQ